jgi:hypothetical protein
MRIPDYGHGDWEVKYARNRNLPSVEKIGLDGETIYIALSRQADSIKVTGQDHTTLSLARNSSAASYTMRDNDPYARITATVTLLPFTYFAYWHFLPLSQFINGSSDTVTC